VLEGAYLSASELFPSLLALLAPILPFELTILFINEYEKRYNSSNFTFIKIKLSGLIELKFLVKINLLQA
jgi:hypothetical protein